MKKYIEYVILSFIIIILISILYIDKKNKIHYKLPTLPKIEKSKIDKIVINNGKQNKIILKKLDNNWIINNKSDYKVDQIKIENILNLISQLRLISLVSKGRNYSRYSLDEVNKITLTIWEGQKKILSLSIGKLAPNYTSTYVKIENRPDIYLAQENLRVTFDTTIDDLRDKHLLSFNLGDLNKINLFYNKKNFIIKRQNNMWSSNKEVNDTVEDLLKKLQTIECESFLRKEKKKETNTKYLEIELFTNSKTHFLRLYKSKENKQINYIGESSNLPDKFKISRYSVEELEKDFENIISKIAK